MVIPPRRFQNVFKRWVVLVLILLMTTFNYVFKTVPKINGSTVNIA